MTGKPETIKTPGKPGNRKPTHYPRQLARLSQVGHNGKSEFASRSTVKLQSPRKGTTHSLPFPRVSLRRQITRDLGQFHRRIT
jgi:hypothetical protein